MNKIEYRCKQILFICILFCLPFITALHTYPEIENNMLAKNKQLQSREHVVLDRERLVKSIHLHHLYEEKLLENGIFESTIRMVEGDHHIDISEGTNERETIHIVDVEKQQKINELKEQIDSMPIGTINENVKTVQKILQSFGYYKGDIDGIYGPLTKQALQIVESVHDITLVEEASSTSIASGSEASLAKENKQTEKNTPDFDQAYTITNEQPVNLNSNIIETAKSFMDTPYVWGGTSASGFDCSGFIQYVFHLHGYSIPRTVKDIWDFSSPIDSPAVGDLVFFQTYTSGASHLGIYLGDGDFIHAGVNDGVSIGNINNSYWKERYLGSKRIPS